MLSTRRRSSSPHHSSWFVLPTSLSFAVVLEAAAAPASAAALRSDCSSSFEAASTHSLLVEVLIQTNRRPIACSLPMPAAVAAPAVMVLVVLAKAAKGYQRVFYGPHETRKSE